MQFSLAFTVLLSSLATLTAADCIDCEIRIAPLCPETPGAGFDWCCWKDRVFAPENQDVCGGCPIQAEATSGCK